MFHVTYEIITPESAEHGDAAERGFVLDNGWHELLPDDVCGPGAGKIMAACGMRLREAANLVGCVEDCGAWFCESDDRQNYRTGEATRYSLHPPENITAASYRRLRRVLGIRR